MSSIDKEQVYHIAKLSRISLTEDEAEDYTHQLAEILEYASHLSALSGAPELSQLRVAPDIALTRDNTEELLQNAVAIENGYVKVPAILDRSETA